MGGIRRRRRKPDYCFVWPKDGKNGNRWGRFKDLMTNSGPDIYVSPTSGRICPTRAEWSQWNERRPGVWLHNPHLDLPWARRRPEERFDFRRRKYCIPDPSSWRDVRWPGEPNSRHMYPLCFQGTDALWYFREY